MAISVEQVLQTIDITKNSIDAIKTVCNNQEQYTQYITDEDVKRNIKVTAESMLTYIQICEQYVEDTIDQVKKRFDKLTDDILEVNTKYGQWIDELNQWLNIPDLEEQMVNERLSDFAKEFPNQSNFYQGTLVDRINLYIVAIQKKIEELIQKLYDTVQEYVEIVIQKLNEFVDPYLKKLKELGDNLIQQVTDWVGDLLQFGDDSEWAEYAKAGFAMAQDVLKQLGLEVPEDLGYILNFGNNQNQTDIKVQVEAEKSYKEGIFNDKPDPREPDYFVESGLGLTENDKSGNTLFNVPESSFNTSYTKQFPTITPGGHIEDKDDTPGSERYYRQHPQGTFTEEQPNGTKINYIKGEKYEIIDRNGNIEIKGQCNLIVGNGITINVAGDAMISVGGNSVQLIRGDVKQTIQGNSFQKINGNVFEYIKGNVLQKIEGEVKQTVIGNQNFLIQGNSWQFIKGNSEQRIDGQSKQYIIGNSEQFIDGTCLQQIKGTLTQKVTGDVNQTLSANVNAKVGGNFDLQISGQFKVKSQQTTLTQSGETTIQGSRISLN